MVRVLYLGDVVGKPGRLAVRAVLPALVHRHTIDLVVANCENVAGGAGVDPESCRELLNAGVDVLTSGNHVWRKKEIYSYIEGEPRLLRPANFPAGAPGRGVTRVATAAGVKVVIVNLIGRTFMDSVDCPFQAAERILAEIDGSARVVLVDMHAEATSEKSALGWFLDGRVSAVLGSHTHVQTADERVLPQGTGFLTDAGMCGPLDSVIGIKPELAIHRFRTHLPVRFEVAGGRTTVVHGAVVSVDPETGRALGVERVREVVERP